jgi:hypothetical protein
MDALITGWLFLVWFIIDDDGMLHSYLLVICFGLHAFVSYQFQNHFLFINKFEAFINTKKERKKSEAFLVKKI